MVHGDVTLGDVDANLDGQKGLDFHHDSRSMAIHQSLLKSLSAFQFKSVLWFINHGVNRNKS